MLGSASKGLFHLLALIKPFKTLASRYGMRQPSSFARRFIAGETTSEAIDAARVVEGRGLLITMDHLGESVGAHGILAVERNEAQVVAAEAGEQRALVD